MCQSRECNENIPILMFLLIKKRCTKANIKDVTSGFKRFLSSKAKTKALAKNFKIAFLKNHICLLTKYAKNLAHFPMSPSPLTEPEYDSWKWLKPLLFQLFLLQHPA